MEAAGLFAATCRASSCARRRCSRPSAFLFLGASDLAVDFLWLGLALRRRCAARPCRRPRRAPPGAPGPARDLRARLGRGGGDRRDAGARAGARSPRPTTSFMSAAIPTIRRRSRRSARAAEPSASASSSGPAPGPTSKADCLNRLWERMIEDEAADGMRFKAVVLHDAEDVVHSAELGLFDALIERFDLVQLPVLPLIDPAFALDQRPLCRRIRRGARQGARRPRRRSAPACPRPASAARSRATR